MSVFAANKKTLLGALQSHDATRQMLTTILLVVASTIILTIAAKTKVPFFPVPMTLQTLAVALIAAGFGWRIGVATVALYLVEGIAGLPVFAGSSAGAAYLMGPTGGFLLAMLPMAFLIGWAADQGLTRKTVPLFLTMLIADALLFVTGYLWLASIGANAVWLDQSNVFGSAFAKAVQPFIYGDLFKMALAALIVTGAWKLVDQRKKA